MNNVLFEIAFEYEGKLYHEVVDSYEIDHNHYSDIYDYWFGEGGNGLCFELNGRKGDGGEFLPVDLCVCVYHGEDEIHPRKIISDLWLKLPGKEYFSEVKM